MNVLGVQEGKIYRMFSDPVRRGAVELVKGHMVSKHSHTPNQEESEAENLTVRIKRKAEQHPEQRPAQLLHSELQGTSCGVFSQLSEKTALVRRVRRVRQKKLPPNSIY